MSINFTQFDESAIAVLKKLAREFPTAIDIGFDDVFPELEGNAQKRAAYISVLTFLKHENFITHEVSSPASFILTSAGLNLFEHDVVEHLKIKLND